MGPFPSADGQNCSKLTLSNIFDILDPFLDQFLLTNVASKSIKQERGYPYRFSHKMMFTLIIIINNNNKIC